MNRHTTEANWRLLRAKVKERWNKLTAEELDRVAGNYDILCGKIQEAYGLRRDQIERELAWLN